MRFVVLAVLLAGCSNYPVSSPSGTDDAGGSGGTSANSGGSGGDSQASGGSGGSDAGGSGGNAGGSGGSGGAGGDVGGSVGDAGGAGGLADPGCGTNPPPCFALENAFFLPAEAGTAVYPKLMRPLANDTYNLVDIVYEPDGTAGVQSLTLGEDGSFVRARRVTNGYFPSSWSAAYVQDGFAVLVDGSMIPEHRELGYGPTLARFGGDDQLGWAVTAGLVPQGATWNEDKLLLALSSGDLIAFMHGDGDQQDVGLRPYSLMSWSADGARSGEASVGKGLMYPGLLELADGRVLLLVSYDSTGAAFALEVQPSLETKPLAQLASWGVWNSVALPDGGFAVGGPVAPHSQTSVGSSETGQVVFESPDFQGAFVASFDGAGALRWARQTHGGAGARVVGTLPDGGVVVLLQGDVTVEVDAGDYGKSRSVAGSRALAVFGPKGDLRVLQPEPSLGSEYGLLFDTASQTLVAQGGVNYEDVVLGAGQPRQTTLHNPSPTTRPTIPALAIYKYLEH